MSAFDVAEPGSMSLERLEREARDMERRIRALESRVDTAPGYEGPLAALTRFCASMFATTGTGPSEVTLPRGTYAALLADLTRRAEHVFGRVESTDELRSVRIAMPHGVITVRREARE